MLICAFMAGATLALAAALAVTIDANGTLAAKLMLHCKKGLAAQRVNH